MSAAVQRTTFAVSRLLEFCSLKELVAQTGHEPADWPLVVVKEATDNALDACEEAGIAPVIQVTIARERIRVRDNGPGIPPETVTSILNFSTRTSSREAYVAPDRGAQGNALKTLVAMPFALSCKEGRVEIVARGIRHRIAFRVDQIRQAPVLEHQTEAVPVRTGTAVTIHWPASSRSELEDAKTRFLQIAETIALLNPHLALTLVRRDDDPCNDHVRLTWPATRPAWQKWTPSAPTSAHWYRREDLERLIGAYIAHDRERGRTRTVSEFVAEFAGLSGTAKRKAVTDAAGLTRAPLSRLVADGAEFDHDLVDRLLLAMVDESRPIKPERLGIIGREHAAQRLQAMGGVPESIEYKLAKGITTEGRPWVLEVAFAWRPYGERLVIAGVNWSAAIDQPFRELGYWLGERYCGARDPVIVFAHLATPRPHYTDRGKSTIVLDPEIREALVEAIDAVTKRWTKQRRAEIRNASAEHRRRDSLTRQRERKISIKDAFWQVLPEAYAAASSNGKFPALARQIYYAARPKILDLTEKTTLDAGYLSYTLLPLFMMENPELTRFWRVHFKARGNLTEPHTRIKVPLGTKEVGDYREIWSNGGAYPTSYSIKPWSPSTIGPFNRFAGVLAIEKEGFASILIEVGIGDKFDLAIIGNEGQSVEAELALADALGLPIFILHDFDRTGLTIAENLHTGTWRHQYRNRFPVVDIGLRLDQVDGLEDEPISAENLKSVGDERLRECGASEAEIFFLRTRRVELNALTTAQLVALVETALAEHDVKKVIPAADDLAAAWRAAKAHADIAEAVEQANADAARRWAKAEAPADLADQVRAAFDDDGTTSWDEAVRQIAGGKP